jgi:acetylornithine deacetylase/succinyl-diaminopimelate desuccinylase-like protein
LHLPAVNLTELIDLTERLVSTDSRTPREEAAAALIADEIRRLGQTPGWHEVAPGRPNVTVSAQVGPRDSFVTFTGHLDTVGVAEGWTTDPFTPVIRDGRMYGLGALDMKSGVACAFLAFKTLLGAKELHPSLGRIGFAATVDEEGFGSGARALLATEYGKSDLLLLAEPFHGSGADDPVPIVMTGKVLYRIVVHGRTSHALAHPERGINAVDDAARIVVALEQLPLGSHATFGRTNYSVLKIDGGYREYAVVVPERCEIIVTRLLAPGETKASAVRDVELIVAGLGLASEVEVTVAPPYYDPYEIPADSLPVQAFVEAYRHQMGRDPVLGGLLCITDCNIYLGEAGVPTVTFGPRGKGLHEKNEYVEVDTLEPVVRVFMETAIRFSKDGKTARRQDGR